MRSPGIASIDRGTRAGFRDAQAMFREARRAVRGPTAQTNRFFSWEPGCGLAVHVSRSEKICPGGNGRAGKFAQVSRYHVALVARFAVRLRGSRRAVRFAQCPGGGPGHVSLFNHTRKKKPARGGLDKGRGGLEFLNGSGHPSAVIFKASIHIRGHINASR